jgi:CMP-N-acetylneuraminic acid synthetase
MMLGARRILAVVPARAGSKGVPSKNMRELRGLSLIGWAARILNRLPYLDARVISTDAPAYAAEGQRHGLAAPFLRPPELSSDTASSVDTVAHALRLMESRTASRFEIVIVLEPTSPLRLPEDVTRTIARIIGEACDSAATVSRLDPKWHPCKAIRIDNGRVAVGAPNQAPVVMRQQLEPLFWRNGVCYAATRECLLEQHEILGRDCAAHIVEHPVVNIDAEWELDWAEFLLAKSEHQFLRMVSLR